MKKMKLLIVAAAAVMGLVSCGGNADPTSQTTVAPTSTTTTIVPVKTKWTKDEKDFMSNFLLFYIPFDYELVVDIDSFMDESDTEGIIYAVGREVSDEEIDNYYKKLVNAGWEENANGFSDDMIEYEFVEFGNVAYEFHRNANKDNSSIQNQVIAFGTDESTGLFTVATTVYLNNWGICLDPYTGMIQGYFPGEMYDEMIAGNEEYLEVICSQVDESGEETIPTYKVGDFIYPTFGQVLEAIFINDLQGLYPWTNGNFYSESFGPMQEWAFMGMEYNDFVNYTDKLADESSGYELMSEEDDILLYTKDTGKGKCGIAITYNDEFWALTDGTTLPGMIVSFNFEIYTEVE